jgi:hypothetical protein
VAISLAARLQSPARMRAIRLAAAAAIAATAAACGTPAPGIASQTQAAETQFYEQVLVAECQAIAQCCTSQGYPAASCGPDSQYPYASAYSSYFDPDRGALGEQFDPAAAASCLATLQQTVFDAPTFCSDYEGYAYPGGWAAAAQSGACPDLYAGGTYHQTPLGAQCSFPDDSTDDVADTRCAPTSDGVAHCASWTSTSNEGTASWNGCVDFVPVGNLGDVCATGESYVLPVEPTTLRVATQCGPGLTCTSGYVCAPAGAFGDACKQDTDCGSGLFCNPGNSLCFPLPVAGDACTTVAYACSAGNYCNPQYVCAPLLAQGATCSPYARSCGAGLACAADGTCEAPPSVVGSGASCDGVTITCDSASYCDPATSVCTALRAGGAECTGGTQCASGTCAQGTCTVAPAATVPAGCGTST